MTELETMTDLERFTQATKEAMYFTDTGGGGEQPPTHSDLAPETLLDIEADCRSFWRRFGCFINVAECTRGDGSWSNAAQAGHDFWLTRNGHGSGFWDGDWSEPYGEMLSNGSKAYGEFQIYLGDDGLIYA